jgi:hypothetical protein
LVTGRSGNGNSGTLEPQELSKIKSLGEGLFEGNPRILRAWAQATLRHQKRLALKDSQNGWIITHREFVVPSA